VSSDHFHPSLKLLNLSLEVYPKFLKFSFVTRVNLLHPGQSLFLYGLLISLWCFFYLLSGLFQFKGNFVYCQNKSKHLDWDPVIVNRLKWSSITFGWLRFTWETPSQVATDQKHMRLCTDNRFKMMIDNQCKKLAFVNTHHLVDSSGKLSAIPNWIKCNIH